jgi:probable rRNA maturation factor
MEAERDGKSLSDHATHLVVHGILHLAGYDHQTDAEALEMETLETRVLAGLGVADPYADRVPAASASPSVAEGGRP